MQVREDGRDGGLRSDVETLLSRTLARYERVLANVADGIYGLDADGRVEFVNPAAVRMTGLAAEEQLGRDQHAVIHGRRPTARRTRSTSARSGTRCGAAGRSPPRTRSSGTATAPPCRSS